MLWQNLQLNENWRIRDRDEVDLLRLHLHSIYSNLRLVIDLLAIRFLEKTVGKNSFANWQIVREIFHDKTCN